jgi:hypothetical protein
MEALIVAGVACFIALSAAVVIVIAMRRYRRVKAGVNIGLSGFYLEADDERPKDG